MRLSTTFPTAYFELAEQYFGYQVPSLGAHKSRYPTKQQKPPRRIKFLQERLDHSGDVHDVGQAFALMCATLESGAGG